MEQIFTIRYLFDVICVAMAFFTFILLVSNDVYLSMHRILPTIAGIITIFDFYICIMPFVRSLETVYFLRLLCDMCATVIMFMMFFYFLFIKRPKFTKLIVVVSLILMISLCVFDFVLFNMDRPKPLNPDLVAVIFVFAASVVIELKSESIRYFDRTDKIIGRYMMVAFVIAMLGYILHDFFLEFDRIRSIAFLIDSIIFFWLAKSNRIEDTATILKSTIFNRMEYPIALVNADFYVIEANQKAIDLFPEGGNIRFAFENGLSKRKFLLGENLVTNERNDAEYYAGEKWYRVHYNPVLSKGQIKGYIFSASDITEQHKEAVNAKKATSQKSQFLAQMSHELRSPLHAIMGVSDILTSKKDISEKNRNLISHIKRASENLLELVNAILDYSKLEAGKFEFSEKEYDVNALLEDLTYATILNIQSKPIDFNLAITSSYPRYLYGDVIRVREIFQNILSNAVKFTKKGSIHAEISFEEIDGKVKINFSIADTGQGMTPDQIEEVFKEYVSSANNSEIEGTGLGLAITRYVIDKLGGNITAESDGLTGSVFKGYFYQKSVSGEILTEKVLNRRTLMNQNQGFHGLPDQVDYIYPKARILVADDMRINLEIMEQLLAPWKCEVVTVPDGASAVRAVQESHFDLILLDQMMVPVSGPEACKRIREYTDVPTVLVTANSEENARYIVENTCFSEYLTKPIMGIKLKEIIEKYLPENLAEDNNAETVMSVVKRNIQSNNVYHKTLETFVKEMQPLLLNLPNYRNSDKEMFKVKVHGINGVSKQIGRDTFAKQAQIMEMAAKSETWSYVDEHMEEFLNSLCEVVDDATKELTQLAPDKEVNQINENKNRTKEIKKIVEDLYKAFDNYDLSAIEESMDAFEDLDKDSKLNELYERLCDAYDDLEYEEGARLLEEYLEHN